MNKFKILIKGFALLGVFGLLSSCGGGGGGGGSGPASSPPKYLYLANWAASNTRFDIYDIEADTWAVGADLPVASKGELTSTDTKVLMYGNDNFIYEYDVNTDAWGQIIAGPPGGLNSFLFFQYLNDTMYLCTDGTTTVHVYHAVSGWTTVTIPAPCSLAGGVDPVANEVYVKRRGQAGFTVIDATTNTVARTITDATSIGESTSSAAFVDGWFYTRNDIGNIFALDGIDGTFVDTTDDPTGQYPGFKAEHTSGNIYIHSSVSFDLYDPVGHTFTPLTTGPTQSTLGTITLTY